MHSLRQSSRVRHEDTNVSFGIRNAGSCAVPCPLTTAQCARPDLVPTSYDSLQATLARVDGLVHKAIHPVYTREGLIPATHLSTKTYNALLKGRIATIEQLCAAELCDLKLLRNFGKKAVAEVAAYRAHLGAPLQ